MVMISKEIMKDYENRAFSLGSRVAEIHSKAQKLVVEGSPVDCSTHKLICSIHFSEFFSLSLGVQIWCWRNSSERDDAEAHELVKKVQSLEEELAFQNELLDSLASTHTARAGDDK